MRLLTRHPLCPACRYDLAGTVAAGQRRCPECGEPFEQHELLRAPRPGDWTLARGFRHAALLLVAAGAILSLLWLVGLWSLARLPFLQRLGFFVVCGLGYVVGRTLTTSLAHRVGFQSWLLPPAVFLTVMLATTGGTFVAGTAQIAPPQPILAAAFAVVALVASVAQVLMDS